ncbi:MULTISPECIES: type III secretion protein [Photorhabdus]|uniref:Type iii secretion component protein scto n=2 Tax=Photorhabdus asymbiotica TaxID=291112 RepID=B6VK35_PHOAA|nr:type III secretion protein [Photorhabdus asymbiotica]RKS66889.1 type III secretion protein O [Photorhabdus asymbiotica]CAQ83143.1 type iii secretion component protein scto [Photorhabdus asymbiotica]CAR66515.1 type iii secretion component protein scto [Photorhabdus asymbiotica subsp. asymbiotica ATCC 43949]
MISRLQRIKALRVKRAEQHLSLQQMKLQTAHQHHEQALRNVQNYSQWRIAEEQRLFKLCQGQPIDRKGLERWQQQVALLRKNEAQLERKAAEILEQVELELRQLQECQRVLHHARRQQEKFNELGRQEQEALRIQGEYQEELEQEEFHRQARV